MTDSAATGWHDQWFHRPDCYLVGGADPCSPGCPAHRSQSEPCCGEGEGCNSPGCTGTPLRVGYGHLRGLRQVLGGWAHKASDGLHLIAHALVGDDDWRARNG